MFLLLIGGALFGAAAALTSGFHAREQQLAREWYERGRNELAAGDSGQAITDFRSALLYARDDRDYRMALAEALARSHQYSQAEAYFRSLLELAPGDGDVNLELARVAAAQDRVDDALRSYQAAIYGVWPSDPQEQRLNARLELVHFLLRNQRNTDAEAQLVALTADLPDRPALLADVGWMFAQLGDNQHAAALFRRAIRPGSEDEQALVGLGSAELNLGDYADAHRQFQRVLQHDPGNVSAKGLLPVTAAMLSLDPFARVAGPERRARILRVFQVAAARLQQCRAAGMLPPFNPSPPSQPASPMAQAAAKLDELTPHMTERNLRDDPDLGQDVLDGAFAFEQQSQSACGPMSAEDNALIRLAAVHPQ